MTEPTDVAFAPDGRVFVSEKSGLIKVFSSLNATTPTIAADLRTQVYNFWDRGLLSIALDPQFPIRPYLYAIYTADAEIGGTAPKWGQPGVTSDSCPTPPGATELGCIASTRLVKLTLSGNVVTDEQVLINDWCQQFPSHSAGGLVFGPDGMLYASNGEGASFNYTDYGQEGNVCGDPPVPVGGKQATPTAKGGALRAQDFLTPADPQGLDGSLIRIDPDTGAGAPGNPMSASSDANARRIVASGMRNPFRFTFRPGTSEIYVGDVGWGTWEEINRLPKADDSAVDDFGWPCYEGPNRSPAYEGAGLNLCKSLYNTPGSTTAPLFAYEHGADVIKGEECTEAGSSISGLAFYAGGGNYPAAYNGALFFADYSRRCIWVMFEKNGLPDPSTRIGFTNDNDPVNIKFGPGGDLYIVDFTGSLRRIGYPGGNRAPTAVAKAEPQYGSLPLTVNFDGTSSTDPDAGDTLSYAWDLDGDGQYDDSTAAKPSWTYTSPATVTARLRVTDKVGLSATDSIVIGAGNEPPHAQIDTPTEALHWAVGDPISFSGHATDPQDGALGAASLSWSLVLRHCATLNDCHSHSIQSYPGVTGGSFIAPDHEYPSYLELRLTATDSGGLSNTQTLRLDPRTVDLTFKSEPAGLTLSAGELSGAAPFTKTVIVGSHQTITAATPQLLNNAWQEFSSWSDGGAATHDLVAPGAATTYTATYKPAAASPGLVLAYGFEETSGTVANDSSPAKNNGTINGPVSTASGRFGRALSFDGVNDRVDVPDSSSLDLTTGMTLEAWVKPTTISGWRTAILKERGTTDLDYALYASNGSRPRVENYTGVETGTNGTAGLPLNAWTHLAATYDGANLRLYVNGALVATKAASGPMPNTANPLRIGGNAIWGEYFSGLIDEVRVYNRALSEAEVKADMQVAVGSGGSSADTTPPSAPGNLKATGAIGKVLLSWEASTDNTGVTGYEVYRSTTPGFTPSSANRIATPTGTSYTDTAAAGTYYYRVRATDAAGNLSNSSAEASGTSALDTPPTVSLAFPTAGSTVSGNVTLKANASDDDGVSGVQFLVDGAAFGAEDTTAPYEISWPSTGVTNGPHKLSARARDTAGTTTTSAEVTVTVNNVITSNGLVLAYGFEETSGTVANDSSPAKNNGTINGPLSTMGGKFGRALSFDGVNDRVDVPDSSSLDLTTGMTLEAWVKPTTISGWRTAILKERGTTNMAYSLYPSNDAGKPTVENFTSAVNPASGSAALALNAWTHLASTYDGTNLRLYVNGSLAATKAATGPMPNTANPLRIGGNTVWGDYFSGLIDEVRVYNRALSEAEVKADMQAAVGS
jgi:glucose/arabinose dehydrogenase/PKD repeat protein